MVAGTAYRPHLSLHARRGAGMDGACRRERAPGRYQPRRPEPRRSLSPRPGAPRDLARPLPRRSPRCRAGAGLRGAGVSPLPGMRNPCAWLCPGAVGAVRSRLLDRALVQGARHVSRVQCAAHGGDGNASHRSRQRNLAGFGYAFVPPAAVSAASATGIGEVSLRRTARAAAAIIPSAHGTAAPAANGATPVPR
jgi:hypothetical protein